MSVTRLYVAAPLLAGTEVEIPPDRAHYAKNVLRLRAGDDVVLFDGKGREAAGRIWSLERKHSSVRLTDNLEPMPESSLEITLVQAISRGERMDYSVQKATELGVRRIVPLQAARSEVRLDPARRKKRLAHWQGVAVSACEQCGRCVIPELTDLMQLADLVSQPPAGLGLVLDPTAEAGLRGRLRPEGPLVLCVGPEGGFEPAEIERLGQAGFERIRLGPRVLRTETAGPAAIAAIQAFWGDLG